MRNYTLLGCLIEMPRWLRVYVVELEPGLGVSVEKRRCRLYLPACRVADHPCMWGNSAIRRVRTTRHKLPLHLLHFSPSTRVFRLALFDFYLHNGGSATKTRCRERPFYQLKTGWDSQAFGEESGRYCISTIQVNHSIQTDFLQVITLAVRTPLTKARKGGLKDTPLDDLLIALLKV